MAYLQKNIIILTLFTSLLSSAQLQAQSIKTDLDKKVIYTDSLNMPPQTNVHTMLTMMPELLQRPGEVVFSNYDIQVNDISVNDASETALYQLDLEDIEKVEIVESATSSYQKNGEGGRINIVLRNSQKGDNKVWGSASLHFSHPKSVSPQFTLGYKKNKFYLSALVLSDIKNRTTESEMLNFKDNQLQNRRTNSATGRFRSQLANILMEYNLTNRDQIKLKLSETFRYEENTLTQDYNDATETRNKEKATVLNAVAFYKHNFNWSELQFEVNYKYNPITTTDFSPELMNLEKEHGLNILGGKVEYMTHLLNPSNQNKRLKLGVGNLFNLTFGDDDIKYRDLRYNQANPVSQYPENDTYFLQPYAFVEAIFGKFRIKAQSEFQYFRYKMTQDNEFFDVTSKDLTGRVFAEWHFRPNKMLRLLGARELQRPANTQLFPVSVFNPSDLMYVKGNPDLTPILTHEIRLDYIADHKWDDHKLHYDVNVSYKHVGDMIEPVNKGGGTPGGLGATMQYKTFANNGKNDIVSGNIMAMYSHKAFALTLTANIFNNKKSTFSGSDHYTYYNISFNPHFTLKDSWQGSLIITYNSSVKTKNSSLSDCTQFGTLLGKRWQNFYAYFFCNLALDKDAKDISWQDNIRNEHIYEMIPNSAGFCIKYLF